MNAELFTVISEGLFTAAYHTKLAVRRALGQGIGHELEYNDRGFQNPVKTDIYGGVSGMLEKLADKIALG